MALITNNISGSSSDGSKIGITGSIIISNSPDAQFPSLGSDAVFFVSGSETAKAVLGGAAKISGSLSTDSSVTLGNSSDDTITVTGTSVFLQPIGIKGDETADNAKIHFKASDSTNRFTIETDLDASTANDLLGFRSTTTDNILVLKGTGNVGIGTTALTPTFIVSGSSTAATTTTLIKGGAPNQTGPIFEVDNNDDTTLLFVSGSGNITVGTTSLSSLVNINAGSNIVISGGTTGNVLLNNTATTNTIALGGTSQTGTITIGQSTSSNTINIGNGTIDPAATQTIQIAGGSTGTARSVISIGSSSGSGALTLRAGTGNITLSAGTTGGAIVVGDSTVSNTISIGNSTTATGATQTINIATAATGTGKALISIGNTNGASGLILSAGTGGITISSSTGGNIVIGNAATTGTIAIGATGQTGTITIGQSTDTNTINIGAAVTASTKSQNVNIANATASGGIANVNIANSSAGTNTITIGKFGSGLVNVVLGGDAIKIGDSTNTDLGFFNTTPAPKQTPASDTLANLYTALRAYGLIG